jgi:hypothetical protein
MPGPLSAKPLTTIHTAVLVSAAPDGENLHLQRSDAQLLDVSERTLWYKLKKLDIE